MRQGCFRSAGCGSSGFDRRANLLKSYFSGFRPAEMHFFRRKNRFLLREASRTSDSAFPASSSFYHLLTPKGGTKSVRQAKSSGNGRRMHLKRYSASSRPRFRRRIRRPFFFPFFRNAESVVRCAQLRLFVCVRTWQIYGLRDCTAKIADEVSAAVRSRNKSSSDTIDCMRFFLYFCNSGRRRCGSTAESGPFRFRPCGRLRRNSAKC